METLDHEEEIIFVCTSVDSLKEARSIAKILIEEKLCACVQIDQVRSIYEWEEEICEELESRLTIKTIAANFENLEIRLLDIHPYDLPEIISLPTVYCFNPYAEWIVENSTE
ncbi:MAG: hypothetical protein CBC42_07820 [Betaproteobacteria bacterium TMED82]|nr:MAG: hypothetical protein CBC42_07820 [Betaproteobacteria bacterium TMED82]|tara:strand:- start:16400 stop:16735 length:336 start_codon:yes stop_codon:yes gene_type:complete